MHIDRFLATHDGVASRAQARGCDLSNDQIARKLASGEWIRRATAVFFAVAFDWTAAARVRVAAEWVRPVGSSCRPAIGPRPGRSAASSRSCVVAGSRGGR